MKERGGAEGKKEREKKRKERFEWLVGNRKLENEQNFALISNPCDKPRKKKLQKHFWLYEQSKNMQPNQENNKFSACHVRWLFIFHNFRIKTNKSTTSCLICLLLLKTNFSCKTLNKLQKFWSKFFFNLNFFFCLSKKQKKVEMSFSFIQKKTVWSCLKLLLNNVLKKMPRNNIFWNCISLSCSAMFVFLI